MVSRNVVQVNFGVWKCPAGQFIVDGYGEFTAGGVVGEFIATAPPPGVEARKRKP